jgi:hypothetical protein
MIRLEKELVDGVTVPSEKSMSDQVGSFPGNLTRRKYAQYISPATIAVYLRQRNWLLDFNRIALTS